MNKFWGSVFLISGTTIGAGMLGIPVLTGFAGFFPALAILFFFWIYMLVTAFLYLKVNLAVGSNVNFITMTEKTLGLPGKAIGWVVYLLLLYSLTAAYMAGSAPLFNEMIKYLTGHALPVWAKPLPLLIFFGTFIYLGARSSDYINRLLMIGLIVTYVILFITLPPYVDYNLFRHIDLKMTLIGLPLITTSFGFHVIIPTLATYMKGHIKQLKLALVIGSFIPFLIYAIWIFLVLGIVKVNGANSLSQMFLEGQPSTKALIAILIKTLNKPWIARVAGAFSFFAIISSFVGVTLSLSDFLTDGFKIKRNNKGRLVACLLTFLPPLIFLYGYQKIFLQALQYAGVFVAILLCIMPALMTWRLPKKDFKKTFWKKFFLIVIIIVALFIIFVEGAQEMGFFESLMQPYLK